MSSPSGSSQQRRALIVAVGLGALVVVAGVGLAAALRQPSAAATHTRYAKKVAHARSTMQQLAASVNSHYQNETGKPLDTITIEKAALVPGKPVKQILVVHVATQQANEKFTPDDSVVFSVCGSSDDCSIPGRLTVARRVLVEREALELALKTLDADPATSFVLVKTPMLMPGVGRISVYFERDQLTRELEQPLTKTLPLATPPPDGVLDELEQKTVDRLVQNVALINQTSAAVKANAIVLIPLGEAMAVAQQQSAGGAGAGGGGTAP